MKASELRIENLVMGGDYEGICRVRTIDDIENVCYVLRLEYSGQMINGVQLDLNELNPIPLTKEWLVKFGFFEGNDVASGEDGYYFSESEIPKIRIAFDDAHGVFVSIRFHFTHEWTDLHNPFKSEKSNFIYVHQLQNLYFALTGQELKIPF